MNTKIELDLLGYVGDVMNGLIPIACTRFGVRPSRLRSLLQAVVADGRFWASHETSFDLTVEEQRQRQRGGN